MNLIQKVNILDMVLAANHAMMPIKYDFRQTPSADSKVVDIRTEVDKSLKNWFVRYPNVGYVSNISNSALPEDCEYIVYVNPLDGIETYTVGSANISSTITLMEKRDELWYPIQAIIIDPICDDLWSVVAGEKTKRKDNGYCSVQDSAHPALYINTKNGIPFHLNEVKSIIENDSLNFLHHELGSVALCAGLIASGLMQATIFASKDAVNAAAMSLIVSGAGGIATDLFGKPLDGFELVFRFGKFEFTLPNGAIFSSSQKLTKKLVQIIKNENHRKDTY